MLVPHVHTSRTWTCVHNPQPLLQGSRTYSPAEKRLFWIGLVVAPVAWGLMAFLEIFRLKFGAQAGGGVHCAQFPSPS